MLVKRGRTHTMIAIHTKTVIIHSETVVAWLDPAIHSSIGTDRARIGMDAWVKPGHDDGGARAGVNETRP